VPSETTGIDLTTQYRSVDRLLGHFLKRDRNRDDTMQDVYELILRRNRSGFRHDPSKSSLGHYIYLCLGTVISLRRNERLAKKRGGPGVLGNPDDHVTYTCAVERIPGSGDDFDITERLMALRRLAKHTEMHPRLREYILCLMETTDQELICQRMGIESRHLYRYRMMFKKWLREIGELPEDSLLD
jgi:phosphate uptake regulator